MIVEDDMAAVMELEELLGTRDCRVAGMAESGVAAVFMAREVKPDLILMDSKLSGEMDGVDAARIIKSGMSVPIVFVTGHSDSGYIERTSRTHPDGFIVKPYYW